MSNYLIDGVLSCLFLYAIYDVNIKVKKGINGNSSVLAEESPMSCCGGKRKKKGEEKKAEEPKK